MNNRNIDLNHPNNSLASPWFRSNHNRNYFAFDHTDQTILFHRRCTTQLKAVGTSSPHVPWKTLGQHKRSNSGGSHEVRWNRGGKYLEGYHWWGKFLCFHHALLYIAGSVPIRLGRRYKREFIYICVLFCRSGKGGFPISFPPCRQLSLFTRVGLGPAPEIHLLLTSSDSVVLENRLQESQESYVRPRKVLFLRPCTCLDRVSSSQ